jgi:hypothetical protein
MENELEKRQGELIRCLFSQTSGMPKIILKENISNEVVKSNVSL